MDGRSQLMYRWVVGALGALLVPNALWAAECKTGASLVVQAEQAPMADDDPSDDVCSFVPEQGEDLNGCDTSVAPTPPTKPPVPSSEQAPALFFVPDSNEDSLANSLRVPCWVSEDTCRSAGETPDYRLPLGHALGWYIKGGSSRYAGSSPYFYSGRCGYGEEAGEIPSDQQLIVYLAYGMAADESTYDSGQVQFKIDVWEYTAVTCTGTINRNFTEDTATCPVTVNNSDIGWLDAWSDSRRDCTGAYGDVGDCHMPDIAITYPGAIGDYSYKYTITTKVCNSDGTNCTQDAQDGCFVIDWVN